MKKRVLDELQNRGLFLTLSSYRFYVENRVSKSLFTHQGLQDVTLQESFAPPRPLETCFDRQGNSRETKEQKKTTELN